MLRLKEISKRIRSEVAIYRLVLADRRTPWLSRVLLISALTYLISPIDLIPDAIPILGQLDDLLIVPGLVKLALTMIPAEVIAEARKKGSENSKVSLPNVEIEPKG